APEQVETLVRQLVRVGLDDVVGFIPSLEGYAPSELDTVPQVTAEEAYRLWQSGEAVILDVRSSAEYYNEGHIPNAIHIHAGRVLQRKHEIPTDKPVIVHCYAGDRSSIAISALRAQGFRNLYNLTGGIVAWQEKGLPLTQRN
ncbi:MAG: rhodanese-like domain-containing protein, partial [Armatimonadota bacterium]|nr:rhodanese-like domain-containing protein [Armatimonadota bacterium]